MEKIGNFNAGYINTVLAVEGYHDLYNFSTNELKTQMSVVKSRTGPGVVSGTKRTHEFVFIPNSGFLNSNIHLMNNCELKLSFDRLHGDVSMLEYGGEITDVCSGQAIEITDCVAITEYVESERLQDYFMKIEQSPVTYYYEDCDIILKNLPLEERNIRLHNIKGGKTPNCIFAGIIPSEALNGSTTLSSTAFDQCGVSGFSITLNGNSVNGYPMTMKTRSAVMPYHRFMDVTSRYMNPLCGEGLNLIQFMHNWIYAHKFEAEVSDEGWLGINIKLDEPFKEPHTLVIWCITDCAITIDNFHQIEKLSF